MKASFNEYLGVLRDCKVSRSEFEPLLCGVLLIREPKDMKLDGSMAKDWGVLSQHLRALCSRYRDDLGENAYAVFNAITELASHPPANRCIHRDRHSFQQLTGNWMSQFGEECRRPDFSISDYLKRLNNGNGEEKATESGNTRASQ